MKEQTARAAPSFRDALRFWWKLGWISFGGPAGQISIMHKEIVERRRWMTEDHFLHALNFCMLLPGPEAQQLATYLGWRLHGAKGGIAAGVLFVLPSVFILFALSWLYMAGGGVAWVEGMFYGLIPAVIAIVAGAVKRIGSKVLKTPGLWLVTVAAFTAIFVFKVSFVIILAVAALIGLIGGKFMRERQTAAESAMEEAPPEEAAVALPPAPKGSVGRTVAISVVCLALWWLPLLAVGAWLGWGGVHFKEGLFFSKAALVTFGGAYAVLPYVSQMTVDHYGWLSQRQMMAGLGLAETTPGPLIMVLQFVGFVAAWQHPPEGWSSLAAATLGAGITTWVTFVPCFLFVFLGAPHVETLRNRPRISSMMTVMTAAVVGVILNLAVWFTWHSLWPGGGAFDVFAAVVAMASWLALERFNTGVIPTLAACAGLGILYRLAVGS
ncbi:chromate efflux transporter [Luteolibacter sp. SL250]|uniref:chromate efflux transporter n=1 Tax=Luteolibacter sp. SL250 TaxID=2995170 RepID=UPI0022722640|nr:chromate efflux transporter [Luteolibacter sp. SL250]WAC20559.1 chromate efflux transporter [Luteolibacter sp. SL250]